MPGINFDSKLLFVFFTEQQTNFPARDLRLEQKFRETVDLHDLNLQK